MYTLLSERETGTSKQTFKKEDKLVHWGMTPAGSYWQILKSWLRTDTSLAEETLLCTYTLPRYDEDI
jgi:hypothetical protein